MRKNVQIPYELFFDLLKYHLADSVQLGDRIKQELEKKMESLIQHDLYEKFKTAESEEEREQARKEYLDRRGIATSFQ